MSRTWEITLPLTTPLSLNNREHWQTKSRRVAALRSATFRLAKAARIPTLERCAVELHYAPRDKRRRDALNLVATLKPVEDGLVDAGVVPDDTAEFVEPTMPKIDDPTGAKHGRLFVIVRELDPLPPPAPTEKDEP